MDKPRPKLGPLSFNADDIVVPDSPEYGNRDGTDIGLLLSILAMTMGATGFGDVKEMANGILAATHFDHVSQKELSDLLKWTCYNPYERLRRLSYESWVMLSPTRLKRRRDAATDFLCAFAMMDQEYRMLGPMLSDDREWSRLKKVMMTEGWSPEEADAVRGTMYELFRPRGDYSAFPECYIGICMGDVDFKRIVDSSLASALGKTLSFDVGAARAFVYAAQLDYSKDAFLEFLTEYVKTGELDVQPMRAALSVLSEGEVEKVLADLLASFKIV